MKLICAIVGKARNAFVVNINEDARVSALMDAVWNRGQGVITGPFQMMQLFLAKTANNEWLDVATAASVVVNETGEEAVMPNEHGDPQGFVWMDPTLALKDPKYFGENFKPGYGEIHVLVVIPTAEPARKKQKLEEEVSMEDLWRYSELKLEESLPAVDHLKKVSPETAAVQATSVRFGAVQRSLQPEWPAYFVSGT